MEGGGNDWTAEPRDGKQEGREPGQMLEQWSRSSEGSRLGLGKCMPREEGGRQAGDPWPHHIDPLLLHSAAAT